MELSLLILVCIHKSYIVYLEKYVLPSWKSHGKSMLKKGGTQTVTKTFHPFFVFVTITSPHSRSSVNSRGVKMTRIGPRVAARCVIVRFI